MSTRIPREWLERLRPYAGQWVAWNRDQTAIVARGSTFDEAKRAAVDAGERELILAQVPPANRWRLSLPPILYTVAVFVAQISEMGLGG